MGRGRALTHRSIRKLSISNSFSTRFFSRLSLPVDTRGGCDVGAIGLVDKVVGLWGDAVQGRVEVVLLAVTGHPNLRAAAAAGGTDGMWWSLTSPIDMAWSRRRKVV